MINIRQNKGFALVFSLIFLFLIVSFVTVYIAAVANGFIISNQTAKDTKAYYVAEAGLADAYERISALGAGTAVSSTCVNPFIPSTCTAPYIPAATTDNGVYAVGASSGSYKVSIVYSSAPRTNYIITSTGTYGNETRTLQLKIIGATIAKYAYWTNSEFNPVLNSNVWWITGMITNGLVQTNGTLNIYGNPTFNSRVTESGASPNYFNNTSVPNNIFVGKLTNNAPTVSLPPAATLSDFQTAGSSAGLVLTGASTIIFDSNGQVTVTGKVINSNCATTTTYNNTTISPPANGVIYVQSTKTIAKCNSNAQDGNATVQGTVSGQLTVAADQNIYISGNVLYNQYPLPTTSNPAGYPNSTDMVGLVANNNVTVLEGSAPSQLTIDGVMMAITGSFNVDQYTVNKDPINGGSADGAVMNQFGSLINSYRGPIGTFNTTTGNLVSGWSDNQSYDNRLVNSAPPGFPPLTNDLGNGVYSKLYIYECNSGVCM